MDMRLDQLILYESVLCFEKNIHGPNPGQGKAAVAAHASRV